MIRPVLFALTSAIAASFGASAATADSIAARQIMMASPGADATALATSAIAFPVLGDYFFGGPQSGGNTDAGAKVRESRSGFKIGAAQFRQDAGGARVANPAFGQAVKSRREACLVKKNR